MAIPSLVQGMIKTEDGKVFELDSPKGSVWLESIGSFRFEPSGDSKPYTVRKEASAYWYGCRKVAGKVRKKYIGKSSSLNVAKLEEIAEALEVPPVAQANKVVERVAEKVAEVAEEVAEAAEGVTEKVTERVAEVAEGVAEKVAEVVEDRLTVLELQVTNLQKAVEALQKALLGKLELGDSLELPKVDNEVAEQLQNELGNLKAENENLRADYAALLESSTHVANKLRQEVQELRSQLATERADQEEIETGLCELKQNSVPAATLSEKLTPDAATILSQLRAKRKKSPVSLADIQAILEIMEES
jgi:myosin heavy subunit